MLLLVLICLLYTYLWEMYSSYKSGYKKLFIAEVIAFVLIIAYMIITYIAIGGT